MTQCTSVAAVYDTANGYLVGYLQCGEPAGHDEPRPYWFSVNGRHYDVPPLSLIDAQPAGHDPGTPHRASLTWGDDDDTVELPRTLPAAIDLDAGDLALDEMEDTDYSPPEYVDPGPHPDSVAGHIAAISAAATEALASVSVPGLCGVDGCVYLAGHGSIIGGQALHSWARPSRAIAFGVNPSRT